MPRGLHPGVAHEAADERHANERKRGGQHEDRRVSAAIGDHRAEERRRECEGGLRHRRDADEGRALFRRGKINDKGERGQLEGARAKPDE